MRLHSDPKSIIPFGNCTKILKSKPFGVLAESDVVSVHGLFTETGLRAFRLQNGFD